MYWDPSPRLGMINTAANRQNTNSCVEDSLSLVTQSAKSSSGSGPLSTTSSGAGSSSMTSPGAGPSETAPESTSVSDFDLNVLVEDNSSVPPGDGPPSFKSVIWTKMLQLEGELHRIAIELRALAKISSEKHDLVLEKLANAAAKLQVAIKNSNVNGF
ncbi:MAG: hypothetical protein MMC33_001941 [Icmadophila ericetorum]|nr:hypothetical protein [Icmadophila ericetorum]